MVQVLIIEDDQEIQGLLSRKLQDAGYQVLTAKDGEEGLKMLREEKPGLVLLDLSLPKISGLELLERKAALPETAQIPVIVISNSGTASDISQARRLGAKDWIIKTKFNLPEIIDKINRVVRPS